MTKSSAYELLQDSARRITLTNSGVWLPVSSYLSSVK